MVGADLDAMIRTGTTKDAYDACDVCLDKLPEIATSASSAHSPML